MKIAVIHDYADVFRTTRAYECLHLLVPQPPGIYDRAAERFTAWNVSGASGGYFSDASAAAAWLSRPAVASPRG